ncbi:MAG: tetratricopeptide repeat protein [Planctomycetota bacterium]
MSCLRAATYVSLLLLLSPLGLTRPSRATPSVAPTQSSQDAAERALERFRAYLEQKPFHEQGFERLVAAAVERNALGGLVDELEARIAEGGATPAQRVILARLYARTDRAAKALATLDALRDSEPAGAGAADFARALRQLRGELLLETGQVEAGLEALDAVAAAAASAATIDARAMERLHTLRAEAALRSGDRARAARAFDDLAAVDPRSFDLALDVAERLARAGLLDEAQERYSDALTIAGDDTPRRCRALAAIGQLNERRSDPKAALEAYGAAYDLLGRGHWLKQQLQERLLSVHTREGTLTAFASELTLALESRRDDVDRRALLARTQIAMRDVAGARATLQDATRDFAADLDLGRQLLAVFAVQKDDDARVSELQRLIEQHPSELELYIELGQVFAASGRLEQARLQWQKSLDERLADPGLCLRLAALHAHHGLLDGAIELIERAIQLEPRELGHYDELARLLTRNGRRDDVPAVLDRAEAAAADDPARLETLAAIAAAFRDHARASQAYERALALRPGDPRLINAVAEHARRAGDPERAATLLRQVVETSADATTARDAAQRLVRMNRDRIAAFQLEEEERLNANPNDRAARYLAALAANERRRYDEALAHLDALLAINPSHEAAWLMAAQLDERSGNDDSAVARFRALMVHQPRQRGRWLGELARLYTRLGDHDAAAQCLDESLALSPDNPATFREVARAFQALGDLPRARECLRQVLRLRPDDAEARLALADLLVVASVDEEPRGRELAHELAVAAAASDDEGLAERARAWLYEQLDERGEVREEIERLRGAVRANPFDSQRSLALIDLFVREREHQLAIDLIDELLNYRPADVVLLTERAELYTELMRYDAALADYAALLRLPDGDRDRLLLRSAECQLRAGDLPAAEESLLQVTDRLQVLAVYRREGLFERATALLDEELARAPDDQGLLERSIGLKSDLGDHAAADEALSRLIELRGETPEMLQRRAALRRAAGDQEGAIDALVQALLAVEAAVGPAGDAARSLSKTAKRAVSAELAREQRGVADVRGHVYQTLGWDFEAEVLARAAKQAPTREPVVAAAFSSLMTNGRYAEAATLLAASRSELEAGRCAVGYSVERWKRILASRDRLLMRRDPVRVAARMAELEAALEGGAEELTPNRIKELAAIHRERGDLESLLTLYESAAERFPNDLRNASAVATLRLELGDFEGAIVDLRALLAGDGLTSAIDPLRPNRKDRERLERRLPAELVPRVTDETVLRYRRLSANAGFDGAWTAGQRPRREDVQFALSAALGEAGALDEARALLAALEPDHQEHVSRAALVLRAYQRLELEEDVARLTASTRAALLATANDPVLRHVLDFDPPARALMVAYGEELLAGGELALGYELATRWGGASAAAQAAARIDDRAALRAALADRWRTSRSALGPAEGAHAAEQVNPVDADFVSDQGLVYLQYLVLENDLTTAKEVLDELMRLAPQSSPLAIAAAQLAMDRGAFDEARETLEQVKLLQIEEARRTGVTPPPTTYNLLSPSDDSEPLSPVYGLKPPRIPAPAGSTGTFFGELADANGFASTKYVDTWFPWDVETALAAVAWETRDWRAFGERLERMLAASSNAKYWIQWELRAAAQTVAADATSLPLWKVVYELDPSVADSLLGYGEALEAAGQADEALRLYRKATVGPSASGLSASGLSASGSSASSLSRELTARITRLDPASVQAAPSLEELATTVAADPKNVALRRTLLARLLEDRRFEEALQHADVLVPLAPHLDEVVAACGEAYFLAGAEAEFIALMRPRLARTKDDDQRIALGARLAHLLMNAGDEAGASDVLAQAFGSIAAGERTAAGFWLQRGEVERAQQELARLRDTSTTLSPWLREHLTEALEALSDTPDLTAEFSLAALDAHWEEAGSRALVDRATLDCIERCIRPLGGPNTGGGDARAQGAAATLEERAAALEGARAQLLRAYAQRLRGSHEGFEDALVELGTAARGAREVALAAVTYARERGAYGRARDLLTRITAAVTPSARRLVETPIGVLDEQAALEVELSALELASASAGDDPVTVVAAREAAVLRWRAALKQAPEALLTLTYAAGFEDAAREVLAEIDAAGEGGESPAYISSEPALLAAIALDEASGGAEVAFDRLLAAEQLRPALEGSPRQRALTRLGRELGRGEALRDAALRQRAAQQDDVDVARRALELVAEVDGVRAALELALEWPAQGNEWRGMWSELAEAAQALESGAGALGGHVEHALERKLLERARAARPNSFAYSNSMWRLLRLMLEAEEVEAARALVKTIPKENDAWVRANVVRYLSANGQEEFALELLSDAGSRSTLAANELELLLSLERFDEALAVILAEGGVNPWQLDAALDGSARAGLSGSAAFDAALESARTQFAAPGEGDARVRALERLVLLERLEFDEDDVRRLTGLEALAQARPHHPYVVAWLPSLLCNADRRQEARALVGRALDTEQRLAACGRSADGRAASQLGALLRKLTLQLGSKGQLVDQLSHTPERRFGSPNGALYNLYNLKQFSNLFDMAGWTLWTHGLVDEAREQFSRLGRPSAARNDFHWQTALTAELRSGDVEYALEAAFTAVQQGVRQAPELCARLFAEVERLDDLEARATAAATRDDAAQGAGAARLSPELYGALQREIALQRGDRGRSSRSHGRPWPTAPRTPGPAKRWPPRLTAGDYGAAYTLALEAVEVRARTLFQARAATNDEGSVTWSEGGPVRFEYGVAPRGLDAAASLRTTSGGLGTIGYISVEDEEPEAQRVAIAPLRDLRAELAYLCGRNDEARAFEAERIARLRAGDGADARVPRARLATTYAAFELPLLDAEAERLLLEEWGSMEALGRRADLAWIAEQLTSLARRRADAGSAAHWASKALELRGSEAAKPSKTRQALTQLEDGDAAGALALFLEVDAEARLNGAWPVRGGEFAHGLAQARAAVEGLTTARPELLRAVAAYPSHARAGRSRELLGGR